MKGDSLFPRDPGETASRQSLGRIRRDADRWSRVLAASMSLVALVVWASFFERSRHERSVAVAATAQRDANLASVVGQYTLRILKNAEVVARFIAQSRSDGASGARFAQVIATRARLNDAFSEIGFCAVDGTIFSSSAHEAQVDARLCSTLAQSAAPHDRLALGPVLSSGGDSPVLLVWPAEGGVVALLVRPRTLLGVLQAISIHEDTQVLLSGDEGLVRARWRSRARADAGPVEVVTARHGDSQDFPVEPRWIVERRRIDGYPLTVTVATSASDVLAQARSREALFFALAIVATAALAAVCVVLIRQQRRAAGATRALTRARRRLQTLNERLEAQVAARTRELQTANRDLEAFSYTIAHDVRAPVSAITGFAQALEPTVVASGDPRAVHRLGRITANARRLGDMTESLLRLARISREPPLRQVVDLSAMAREILDERLDRESTRQAVFDIGEGIHVLGDSGLLRQLLENLLGNAWKFTSRREVTRIAMRWASKTPDCLGTVICIEDNGEGFDSDTARELFRPFTRMHRSEDFPGTGVGLATVQRIVNAHGGRVWIESSPQNGTRVFVDLPAPQAR